MVRVRAGSRTSGRSWLAFPELIILFVTDDIRSSMA